MSTAPWLLDLRGLQALSREPGALSNETLRRFLAEAPADLLHPAGITLLDADAAWGQTEASAILLDWLGARPRHVCWAGWLSDAARDALLLWHGTGLVCTPVLLEKRWHWEERSPATTSASISPPEVQPRDRQTLAYISPLPPQRSGISDYSVALMPALAKHFDIHVVACDPAVSQPPAGATAVISLEEFRSHRHAYQHVLYHLGNSTSHLEMVQLLEEHPGTVVLHDFYLSHGLCSWQAEQKLGSSTSQRLYEAHGYRASLDWQDSQQHGNDAAVWSYPCNLAPLRRATGVIVHSQEARELARRFYGAEATAQWTTIPHLKELALAPDRTNQRSALGFGPEDFVVCSFGFIGRSKLSARLLEAFLGSELAKDPHCCLVLAGSVGGDRALEKQLHQMLRGARMGGDLRADIRITGWIDTSTYRAYQAAADAAVQLRTSSRGESSGTVLDCLAAGIPLIYNAHGSLKELPADCGLRLPDACNIRDLRHAMERLRGDSELRRTLSEQGKALVAQQHRPEHCAELYAAAIRRSSATAARRRAVVRQIGEAFQALDIGTALEPVETERRLGEAATALTMMLPPEPSQRQLFLDVSALAEVNLGSGVQRVVRSISEQLLSAPPQGWRVEPVRVNPEGLGYLYARRFTATLLGLEQPPENDAPIAPHSGDIFLGIDLHHDGVLRQQGYLQLLRAQGVAVHFVVHDLLPCQLPDCFPPGAAEMHEAWLKVVARCDGALGVSRSVADDLKAWLAQHKELVISQAFQIGWFHHGCDFQPEGCTTAGDVMPIQPSVEFADGPILLMVGTVEPRKGYLDVLEAATLLWERGLSFNLVIVGREGWTDLPERQRRIIPRTVTTIREHPLLGKRLFWFESANDVELDRLYQTANGLIGASYGEGFGIPLIEAASYGLPLLLRHLPVFHEVTEGHAVFFPQQASCDELALAMAGFLGRLAEPTSASALVSSIRPQSWQQSAEQILRALGIPPQLQVGQRPAAQNAFDSYGSPRLEVTQPPRPGKRQRLRRQLAKLAGRWRSRALQRGGLMPSTQTGAATEMGGWLQDLRACTLPTEQKPL